MSWSDTDVHAVGARRPDVVTLAAVALHFGVFVAPVYLAAAWGFGWWTPLLWLWYGLLAHGVLLVLHEMCHKLLLRNVGLNEFLGRWLLGPFFVSDFEAFRRRHLAHHRELGEAGDPKYTYRMDISGWRFVAFVLGALTLASGIRRVFYQAGEQSGATPESSRQALLGVVIVQGGFALSLLGAARITHPGSWLDAGVAALGAFVVVHLYGLASLGVLIHALRGIVDHRPCFEGEPREGDAALRNLRDGFAEHWIFGCYGFAEHATHHHYPGVPYYRLAEVTRQRVGTVAGLEPVGGHLFVLWRLIRPRSHAVSGPASAPSPR